jgi:hypothetical protein
MNKTLYVILPYFNFLKKKSFDKNLDLFLTNFKKYTNVQIVISEASSDGEFLEVECFKHLKYQTSQILWYKENLINLAIKSLPEDWNYVAWIDRDVEFLEESWVEQTINSLNNFSIIQPWSNITFLDQDENPEFSEKIRVSSVNFALNNFNFDIHFPHPGHAWAANRNFFNTVGFLYDKMIFGGADLIIFDCIFNFLPKFKKNFCLSKQYYSISDKYRNCFKSIKVSFINQKIIHHFHGKIEDRRKIQFKNEKINRDFIYKELNLKEDMFFYREDGLLQLKENFLYIEEIFKQYLLQRAEI